MESPSPVPPGRRLVGLREGLEQLGPRLLRNADAGIADLESDRHRRRIAAVLAVRPDHHGACLGELHGVAAEIEQDLAQADLVAHHRGGDRRIDETTDPDLVLVADRRRQGLGDAFDDVAHGNRDHLQGHLPGLDLREVEDVVDNGQQGESGGANGLQHLALVGLQVRLGQQVDHADDTVHRRADFVAHGRKEDVLGAGRRLGRVAGDAQLVGLLFQGLGKPVEFRLVAVADADQAPGILEQLLVTLEEGFEPRARFGIGEPAGIQRRACRGDEVLFFPEQAKGHPILRAAAADPR